MRHTLYVTVCTVDTVQEPIRCGHQNILHFLVRCPWKVDIVCANKLDTQDNIIAQNNYINHKI